MAWLTIVAPQTLRYLSPYLGGGITQLAHLFSGSGGGRTLFSASTEPGYERFTAFLTPAVVGVLALVAIWPYLPRRGAGRHSRSGNRSQGVVESTWSPARIGLSWFGLLYFPSVAFILIPTGAEGARRSWAFSYVGLVVLVTPVVLAALERFRPLPTARRIGVHGLAVAVWASALVGNVAAGLDESYRFPGPFLYGSDTRSLTPELRAAAQWFAKTAPPGTRIVTDRYTGLGFVLVADAWTASASAGFPAYDLFFSSKPPSASLVEELRSSDYRYLIIDKRSATQIPVLGVYFEPDEPVDKQSGRHPISAYDIDRYTRLPWTTRVFDSENYTIYRFDFSMINQSPAG
jgi:hypothetical protein